MVEISDPESALVASITHWSQLADLAQFAVERHGFGDTDGGFGITYPDDLDEYDRVLDGFDIPKGYIEAYGFWGPPDGYGLLVPESMYLETLALILSQAGLHDEADRVRAIIPTGTHP